MYARLRSAHSLVPHCLPCPGAYPLLSARCRAVGTTSNPIRMLPRDVQGRERGVILKPVSAWLPCDGRRTSTAARQLTLHRPGREATPPISPARTPPAPPAPCACPL